MKKPIIAFMYDFDKTLCDKDMQEYSFMRSVKTNPQEFWSETTKLAKSEEMDKILAYMYQMIYFAKRANVSMTKSFLNELGKDITYFKGVLDWFDEINKYGEKLGLEIEHYIISSGTKEILEGTPIFKHFKEVFACEFHYNEALCADFPKIVVNYTTKTQYLFRISKGTLDVADDVSINTLIPDEERRVPFRNMIYFGDGLTDVPCMRLVKANGGHSIAIYQNGKKENVKKLLEDKRVDFICDADYSNESELFKITSLILEKMSSVNKLVGYQNLQKENM